ncbi:RNA helicase [Sarracenia purpurea var. burkii]
MRVIWILTGSESLGLKLECTIIGACGPSQKATILGLVISGCFEENLESVERHRASKQHQEKRRCPNRGDSDTPRVEVEDDELEDEEDDDDGKTLVSDTDETESEISEVSADGKEDEEFDTDSAVDEDENGSAPDEDQGKIKSSNLTLIEEVRLRLNVDVIEASGTLPAPASIESFTDMCLHSSIMKDIAFHEYSMPIQAQAMHVALNGRDLLGYAKTGSGKTAAFTIPIIQEVNPFIKDGVHSQNLVRSYRTASYLAIEKIKELAVSIEGKKFRRKEKFTGKMCCYNTFFKVAWWRKGFLYFYGG